jgi:hypothetical protein
MGAALTVTKRARRVEVCWDGRHDYADGSQSTKTTILGEKIMPGVDEINGEPEFWAIAISAEEFEQAWRRATQGGCARRIPIAL